MLGASFFSEKKICYAYTTYDSTYIYLKASTYNSTLYVFFLFSINITVEYYETKGKECSKTY